MFANTRTSHSGTFFRCRYCSGSLCFCSGHEDLCLAHCQRPPSPKTLDRHSLGPHQGAGEQHRDEERDDYLVRAADMPEAEWVNGGSELLRARLRSEWHGRLCLHARPPWQRPGSGGKRWDDGVRTRGVQPLGRGDRDRLRTARLRVHGTLPRSAHRAEPCLYRGAPPSKDPPKSCDSPPSAEGQ